VGAVGPRGPAGAPGLLNVRIVSVTRPAERQTGFVTARALCNANEVVLSGGYRISGGEVSITKVVENVPLDAAQERRSGWSSTAILEAVGKGKGLTLTTYAVCAELPTQ
jgi:integrin beta 3